MSNDSAVKQAARTIALYCRDHICTDCPLNIGDRTHGIMHAHCVCDYNVLRLPSTWQIEELDKRGKKNG